MGVKKYFQIPFNEDQANKSNILNKAIEQNASKLLEQNTSRTIEQNASETIEV